MMRAIGPQTFVAAIQILGLPAATSESNDATSENGESDILGSGATWSYIWSYWGYF